MKKILCKLIGGHFFGITSYCDIIYPYEKIKQSLLRRLNDKEYSIEDALEDERRFYEELLNRECKFCKIKANEVF